MVFSAFMVGIAYTVATASNTVIGWENLSNFWQTVFKIEAILFILQLILIIFVKGKHNWSQMVLNVSYVIYTYKMALDPFVMISRSEEHTSELQSRGHLVCRLLLEKKNRKSNEISRV